MSDQRWRFRQILWLSKKTWTLPQSPPPFRSLMSKIEAVSNRSTNCTVILPFTHLWSPKTGEVCLKSIFLSFAAEFTWNILHFWHKTRYVWICTFLSSLDFILELNSTDKHLRFSFRCLKRLEFKIWITYLSNYFYFSVVRSLSQIF